MSLKNGLADALEDDFALDGDFAQDSVSDHSDVDVGVDADVAPEQSTNKRQRDHSEARDTEDSGAAKKQKKKQRKKQNHRGDGETPRSTSKFTVPRGLDEQAAVWNKFMKKAYPGIAQLELDDIAMQEKHVYRAEKEPKRDTGSYLEDLVRTAVPNTMGKSKITFGAPQVLVICSSALRVIDLVKRMRPLTQRTVLKLFSKHIKIAEHKKILKSAPVDIAVGTPNRIHKLLQDGDLKANRLRLVVVDCWQDDKMRVVIDMDDTRADLFAIWRDILLPASANPDHSFKFRLV
ncbi:Protein cms1 [Coemansia sp. RSA 1813]|nr:Protein cms1 [Coemansia sp. RSA 1646]KAJ1771012.1 Protein cms1 [Coemansia sp. RSA 1843]KAJ2089252.1 Protein cms1 [Coemansia sp. RSA 986]KAJ2215081.1 Protein cms1 [Coemansia sp. RSA 487]KAJ2569022.1 Protein cms1 [Coemansia sp. RSA 1813]